MAVVERSIHVNAPIRMVFERFAQLESFPDFMEGVQRVTRLDATRFRWRAEVGGAVKEWDAELVEVIPDRTIAWRSVGGAPNSGIVIFEPVKADRTRVTLTLEYEPQGLAETVGDKLGLMSRRLEADLESFKHAVEGRRVRAAGSRVRSAPAS